MKILKYIPLFLFLIISVFFYNKIKYQEKLKPLSSALLEKPFPTLDILSLESNESINNYINGKDVIINIFASWCAPCRIEHKVFNNYSKDYTILGIAYKDSVENIEGFLEELGNPYKKIFFDFSGKESINLGLYGVPETFFVDKKGEIKYKHVGPINKEVFLNIVNNILN